MGKKAFLTELKAAFGSGVPIVYVVTHEEARVRTLIAEAAGGPDHGASWTSTRGLEGDASLRLPALAIAAPYPSNKRIPVLSDVHPQLGEPPVCRALRG